MGFERLVRVLQNKQSNYDTDIFSGTIAAISQLVLKAYQAGDEKQSIAFRVIADHVRAIAFTIADGQLPSNTGAGYVIRRILRRAVRYYYSYLEYKQPLLYKLLPLLAKQFEQVFPELTQQLEFISRVVKEEEEAFLRTLEKGLKRMDETMQQSKTATIDGRIAFELFDTYGFPLDLTTLIATENKFSVDEPGFQLAMQEQKERSRSAAVLETADWVPVIDPVAPSHFTGYDALESVGRLTRYRKVASKTKTFYQLQLTQTPFYAESGGQVGDTGTLQFGDELLEVTNTKKENDLLLHFTDRLPQQLDAPVVAKVNAPRRNAITVHHSATHLLHAALRTVLGNHVAQKGSLVNEDQLRFDFSHFARVTDAELAAVAELVNEKIRANIPVIIKSMAKDEAIALGAMALFGEKYGDTVRVVIIDAGYSIELCGGTHVGNTGELGFFKITHEAAVAAGVRRIEAISGVAAEQYINQSFQEWSLVKGQLKNPKDIGKAIAQLMAENNALAKKLEGLEARQLVGIRNELLQKDEIIDNVTFVGDIVEVGNADALKKLCADLKNHLHDHVVVLCANIDGKAFVAIGIADTVVAAKKLDAAKIIREQVAGMIRGGGGGQANLATAGGQEIGRLQEIIDLVKSLI